MASYSDVMLTTLAARGKECSLHTCTLYTHLLAAMEKPAIERKQQVKPDFNCAPLVQVVCIAAIFEYRVFFSFG